ncbi:hypothetical protein KIPB_017271, partial [Kipferlia bialata]
EARAEAIKLMGIEENLISPRDGAGIITPIQDFITGAYVLSHKNTFLTRAEFMQLCAAAYDGAEHIDVPAPAVLFPVPMYTGKQ